MILVGTSLVRLLTANIPLGVGASITTSNLSEEQIVECERLERESRQVRRQKERLAKKGRSSCQ